MSSPPVVPSERFFQGVLFVDASRPDRVLRLSPAEGDTVMLSVWTGSVCTVTVTLSSADAEVLASALLPQGRKRVLPGVPVPPEGTSVEDRPTEVLPPVPRPVFPV